MKETKFKQTEIGMIPDDWEVKEINDICKNFSYGVGAEAKTFDYENKYIRITDIDDKSHKFLPQPLTSPMFFSDKSLVCKNDILIARTGASVGKTYLYDEADGNLIFAGFLMRINVFNNNPNLVFYNTLTNHYTRWVLSESMRSGQPGLNLKQLKAFKLPLPPTLAEQQKIAKTLSDVDNVISTLEKLITKKKNLKQGTMQQLLTGKKRLPGFAKSDKFKLTEIGEIPEDWEVKSFEELFDICTSTISLNFVKTAFYVGTENMLPNRGGVLNYENELNYLSVREYRKEDILFSNIRPYLKKLWLANHNGGCSTDVLVFRKKNKDDSALFLYMLISDDRFFQIVNDNAIGTKMPRGDKNIIKQIKFCLPSKLEQTAIANVLSSMDKEIEALETKLGKYRDLKTGMMQQLLTGKIRLV